MKRKILVVGAGNMGGALIQSWLSARAVSPKDIGVTDVRPEATRFFQKKYGVAAFPNNRAGGEESDLIFLCVKPQQMAEVLDEMAGSISRRHLIISIAAGVRTETIEKRLGKGMPVLRVMPNTPALLGAGALVIARGRWASAQHAKVARALLEKAGVVWETAEKNMDAVTALSGSGPAYIFYLCEALTAAGRQLGLDGKMAEGLARQTIYGSGLMLKNNPESAQILRERVTSPGGTTAAALKVLQSEGFISLLKTALKAASGRARELSRTH